MLFISRIYEFTVCLTVECWHWKHYKHFKQFSYRSLYFSFSVKLFVGGLSWQTEEDHLQEYFSQFGAIDNVQIMKDPFSLVSISAISLASSWSLSSLSLALLIWLQGDPPTWTELVLAVWILGDIRLFSVLLFRVKSWLNWILLVYFEKDIFCFLVVSALARLNYDSP